MIGIYGNMNIENKNRSVEKFSTLLKKFLIYMIINKNLLFYKLKIKLKKSEV